MEERVKYPWIINDAATACNSHKLYPWQQSFFLTKNRRAFITAANQIGKSSINILKFLNLGWRPELWSEYFGARIPRMYIYLYPDKKTATQEFMTKWKPYLSQNPKDKKYGYKAVFDNKDIDYIELSSGVTIFFKFYTQQPKNIQAATADMVGMDEECPESHWNELMVRTQGTRAMGSGYVSMVFTATLGQDYLYRVMERIGMPDELFPDAYKDQISLYDCTKYADGSPTHLTKKYIKEEIIPTYSSKAEILKRVFGRFVKDAGLEYHGFDEERNTEPFNWDMVKHWNFFTGVDFGSGGQHGHSSGISLVAIDPTFTKVRVVKTYWSEKRRMTQGDLLEVFRREFESYNAFNSYDHSATDFGELAVRESIPFNKAEKSHSIGIELMNTLFKTGQLKIFTGPETGANYQAIRELNSIDTTIPKNKRVDDVADSIRYAIAGQALRITPLHVKDEKKKPQITNERMRFYKGLDNPEELQSLSDYVEQTIESVAAMFAEFP